MPEACKVSGNLRIGVSEGDDPVQIKNILQIGALTELPEKSKNIQDNDEDIDRREILRTKGISKGNHRITPLGSNAKIQMSNKIHVDLKGQM